MYEALPNNVWISVLTEVSPTCFKDTAKWLWDYDRVSFREFPAALFVTYNNSAKQKRYGRKVIRLVYEGGQS